LENKCLVPGQLVGSTAGRDAGKLFLVVGVMGDSMIQVADGKGRKIEHPKKKTLSILKYTPPWPRT
jgi:ribosomal protein L14E/L6E/L27E